MYEQYAAKFVGSMNGPMWINSKTSASHNFIEAIKFPSLMALLDFIKVSDFERKDCQVFELITTVRKID